MCVSLDGKLGQDWSEHAEYLWQKYANRFLIFRDHRLARSRNKRGSLDLGLSSSRLSSTCIGPAQGGQIQGGLRPENLQTVWVAV